MVAENDVIMAYRLFMGREPENNEVVRGIAGAHKTLGELRQLFLTSPEFIEKFGVVKSADGIKGHKPLNWPQIRVDVDVAPYMVNRMLKRVEDEFIDLGGIEPHWSVLTEDRFKASAIDGKESEFYDTGKWVVSDLEDAASRCGIDLSIFQSCFELGCGLGRSTIWLANRFKHVYAADISSLHLRMAQAAAEKLDKYNIAFFHLNELARYEQIPSFDVFFSIIVLQHNPPPVIRIALERILSKLNPGGIAYFQIPTYALGYEFDVNRYLESKPIEHEVEVHCLPQPTLHQIIRDSGCDMLEIREEGAVGEFWISNRLLVHKRS